MSSLDTHYSARDIEARILVGIRAAGLNPEQRLSPEELGALDHFHTGGIRASCELLEVAKIRADDCVLDIGAGLAGSARLLASAIGCRVDCIEMSNDYCAGAVLLNRLTGLEDRIKVHQGSALDLPFPDGSFDVVWMQEDTTDTHLSRTIANATPAKPGQLGLAVLVDNLAQKAGNARRSLEEGQIQLVRGIFRVN